jgi:hypothetical protein
MIVLTILTVIFGVLSVIQFLMSLASGSSLRAHAQSSYNDWYRVADLAEKMSKDPSKNSELIGQVHGLADNARNEIKAYSREKLGFVPWFDPPYQVANSEPPKVSFWEKFKSAFTSK